MKNDRINTLILLRRNSFMKKNLTLKESILITSMLFGMFFGAGNLIFPASLGISAGSNVWIAYAGMFITAVGLPLLAVTGLAKSHSDGVLDLSSKVGKGYGIFFSTLLYLTIGPLFAIPRCASTSFSVGAVNLLPGDNNALALAIFSFVFFSVALVVSLSSKGIMTWIGKWLNPLFLVSLAILIVVALINPVDSISAVQPAASYQTASKAFGSGFIEGYNTLDALAGLAFGIVVVDVVRKHEIEEPDRIAANTARSGILSCLFMGVIYLFITLVSTQSASICTDCADGGAILGVISNHYFKSIGSLLVFIIVTLACLKTAIGLITSCSEAFVKMFPHGPSYKVWAIIFCIVSFAIANFGLSTIVAYCVPVLMFLYPLAITLIILSLIGNVFGHSRTVYLSTTVFALIAAIFDFVSALSSTLKGSGIENTALLDSISSFAAKYLPLYSNGLGWVCPSVIGFIIGIVFYLMKRKKA